MIAKIDLINLYSFLHINNAKYCKNKYDRLEITNCSKVYNDMN